MATRFPLANDVVQKLHLEPYPGKDAWMIGVEEYSPNQSELKEATQTMPVEQAGMDDFGGLEFLIAAHYKRDEKGKVLQVIRHYYAYRVTELDKQASWQAYELWMESYETAPITREW